MYPTADFTTYCTGTTVVTRRLEPAELTTLITDATERQRNSSTYSPWAAVAGEMSWNAVL